MIGAVVYLACVALWRVQEWIDVRRARREARRAERARMATVLRGCVR